MKKAKLVEMKEEHKVHDLTSLLSQKPEIVIGRRKKNSDAQALDNEADIFLGEDRNGELLFPILMRGISSKQAVITHEMENYHIQAFNVTTRINDELLKIGEKRVLQTGVNLYFGDYKYGPLTFLEEI